VVKWSLEARLNRGRYDTNRKLHGADFHGDPSFSCSFSFFPVRPGISLSRHVAGLWHARFDLALAHLRAARDAGLRRDDRLIPARMRVHARLLCFEFGFTTN
jgi:hypothetical protein